MPAVHGFNGEVSFQQHGNNPKRQKYRCTRWTLNVRSNPVDITNFIYFGMGAHAGTLIDGDVNMDIVYDWADKPFDDVTATGYCKPGVIGLLWLQLDDTGVDTDHSWVWCIRVINARQMHNVRDVSRLNVVAKIVTCPSSINYTINTRKLSTATTLPPGTVVTTTPDPYAPSPNA